MNHERSLEGFGCVFDTAARQESAIQLVGLAKDVAVPREGFCSGGLPGGKCYEKSIAAWPRYFCYSEAFSIICSRTATKVKC